MRSPYEISKKCYDDDNTKKAFGIIKKFYDDMTRLLYIGTDIECYDKIVSLECIDLNIIERSLEREPFINWFINNFKIYKINALLYSGIELKLDDKYIDRLIDIYYEYVEKIKKKIESIDEYLYIIRKPLMSKAIADKDLKMIKILFDIEDNNTVINYYMSLYYDRVMIYRDISMIDDFISLYYDYVKRNKEIITQIDDKLYKFIIMFAIDRNDIKMIIFLLDSRSDTINNLIIDEIDGESLPLLYYSYFKTKARISLLLIDRGADINTTIGNIPFIFRAFQKRDFTMLDKLLEKKRSGYNIVLQYYKDSANVLELKDYVNEMKPVDDRLIDYVNKFYDIPVEL